LEHLVVPHGVIAADLPELSRPLELVQVASIQTLSARAVRRDVMQLPNADLVIVDEAHHALAESYREIARRYPDATLLGLTATPCRGDGRGLGSDFQGLIEGPQVRELIKSTVLVPTRVYAPCDPDLKGVKTTAGDYNLSQLAARMDQTGLVGDIVTNWHKFGERRRTICFATSVEHSVHIRNEFVASGVRCEHLDGGTPEDEREETLRRLASGELEVVTNCAILSEGWDQPEVAAIILARPTKSFQLYRQMVGRVIRACPAIGKRDAVVLDHADATFRHGFVEDDVDWALEPDKKVRNPKHEARPIDIATSKKVVECAQCNALRVAGSACANCGFMPQRRAQSFACDDGELALVTAGKARARVYTQEEKIDWFSMLIWIGNERGYHPGWAKHKYKDKFRDWPSWNWSPKPKEPTAEVRSWVRSRQIAFAKAKQKEREGTQ